MEELAGQLLESAGEQQLEQVVGRLVGTASDPGFSGTPTVTALR